MGGDAELPCYSSNLVSKLISHSIEESKSNKRPNQSLNYTPSLPPPRTPSLDWLCRGVACRRSYAQFLILATQLQQFKCPVPGSFPAFINRSCPSGICTRRVCTQRSILLIYDLNSDFWRELRASHFLQHRKHGLNNYSNLVGL